VVADRPQKSGHLANNSGDDDGSLLADRCKPAKPTTQADLGLPGNVTNRTFLENFLAACLLLVMLVKLARTQPPYGPSRLGTFNRPLVYRTEDGHEPVIMTVSRVLAGGLDAGSKRHRS
jgi:hypothetical protein